MNSSASRSSFSGLLEANNNLLADPIDVVSLLHLRSTDDEDAQVSNSSSLESLTSLDNNQGKNGHFNVKPGFDGLTVGKHWTELSAAEILRVLAQKSARPWEDASRPREDITRSRDAPTSGVLQQPSSV